MPSSRPPQVSEHLTLPLLTMVSEYQRREQELFKMLAAKDKELDDIRVQGGKTSRRKYTSFFVFFLKIYPSNHQGI